MLDRHSEPDSKADFAQTLGGVLGRLTLLAGEPWAPLLFSEKATAASLGALLLQGKCVIIEGASQSAVGAGKAERLVVYALQAAMRARRGLAGAARSADWVFGFGQFANYLSPAFGELVAHARGARIALLMTTADRDDLTHTSLGKCIQANVWNQLFLGGLTESRIVEIVQELRASPATLCQPGMVQWLVSSPS